MAEIARNVMLAVVAVTSLHLALITSKPIAASTGASPDREHVVHENKGPQSCLHQESFWADRAASDIKRQAADDAELREMFEFASAKGTWGVACDRPDLSPLADGAKMKTRTDSVYPEQIAGPYATVNAYEGEPVANGGGGGSGGVAAFDGWGDVAEYEPCQTDGTNSH